MIMQNDHVDQSVFLAGFGTDLRHQYEISQSKSQILSGANAPSVQSNKRQLYSWANLF